MSGIQARMKQMSSINELPLAITSKEIIENTGLNIDINNGKTFLKEPNIRTFIRRYNDTYKDGEKNDLDEYDFNNNFIKYFNSINELFLKKASINCNTHILDCSILDVNLDNEKYEYSSITFKGGKHLRGYKIGLLKGVTENGVVLEEVCMSSLKTHDIDPIYGLLLTSLLLKGFTTLSA